MFLTEQTKLILQEKDYGKHEGKLSATLYRQRSKKMNHVKPKNIFFLTCDAYGVLPPINKLSAGQAMYQFISGYTAKVAGTEEGVKEPKATFSACFGALSFLYIPANMQKCWVKIKDQNVKVWMINTGWIGGGYGVGTRIKLRFTRSMINAVLNNQLDHVEFEEHPVFGVMVPKHARTCRRYCLNLGIRGRASQITTNRQICSHRSL